MVADDDLRRKYEDTLSGHVIMVRGDELGGSNQTVVYLKFEPYHFDHLLGRNSRWHEEKRSILPTLLVPQNWKMFGTYIDNMGDRLNADILVGTTSGCFGFREYDNEDGLYYPCTCLMGDIRDLIYKPYHRINAIEYR